MTVGTKNVPGQRNIRKIHRGIGSFVSTFRLFRTNEFWRLPAGAGAVGADFSYSALKIAQKGVTSASLAQADATKLPFLAESFDIVVSCETIEHLPDPLSGLSEMARVCRPGGLLYLTTPNYFNLMGLYRVYDSVLGRPQRSEESQPYDTV
jgi:SAM-dependent methyltransferase